MKRLKYLKNRNGFTLLELMVTLSIVSVISAVAMPTFNKYVNDALLTEQSTIALQAYRAQKVLKGSSGSYTEALEIGGCEAKGGGAEDTCVQLDIRVPTNKFNLVLGSFGYTQNELGAVVVSNSKFSFNELGYDVPAPTNTYGMRKIPGGYDPESFIMGVEGNMDGDSSLSIMAINEKGILFQLCDDFYENEMPAMKTLYLNYSGGKTIDCGGSTGSSISGGTGR